MAIRRNLSQPLAVSAFDVPDKPKKKKKKSTTTKKVYDKTFGGDNPDPRFSKLSPAQQKAMIQKIKTLNAKGDTTAANKIKEKLNKERSKGYYKR